MTKGVVLFIVGLAAGGLTAYLNIDPRAGGGDSATVDGEAAGPAQEALAGDGNAADTASVDVRDAADVDSAAVGALLAANAAPPSFDRDLEIDVLLARLSADDPAAAVTTALRLGLADRFVESAFKYWAETDEAAALTALATIAEPLRKQVALAMTDVLGAEPAAIERIARALGERDPLNLQTLSLIRLGRRDPDEAFRITHALTERRARYGAFQDLGAVWGVQDPRAALAAADSAPPPGVERIFTQRVLQAWSRLDVAGFLEYAANNPHPQLSAGFAEAALGDPVGALRLAASLPDAQRRSLTMQALNVLAHRDPSAAIERVAALPLGAERDSLLEAIASSYAARDANAALAWAQSLEPRSRGAEAGVLATIAADDLARALDLAVSGVAGGLTPDSRSWFSAGLSRASGNGNGSAAYWRIADRLGATEASAARELLDMLGTAWSVEDPAGAIGWAASNGAAGERVLTRVAAELGRRDLDRALSFTPQLPRERQTAWVADTAVAHAMRDPSAALRALDTIRGDPAFERAVPRVVIAAAGVDAAATGRWVLTLPTGAQRDGALQNLLARSARSGTAEPVWLDGFSSTAARQSALMTVLPSLTATAPSEARALVARYVTDSVLRAQAERILNAPPPEPIQQGGPARRIVLPNGEILILQ